MYNCDENDKEKDLLADLAILFIGIIFITIIFVGLKYGRNVNSISSQEVQQDDYHPRP